jgi:hypothetical protein
MTLPLDCFISSVLPNLLSKVLTQTASGNTLSNGCSGCGRSIALSYVEHSAHLPSGSALLESKYYTRGDISRG